MWKNMRNRWDWRRTHRVIQIKGEEHSWEEGGKENDRLRTQRAESSAVEKSTGKRKTSLNGWWWREMRLVREGCWVNVIWPTTWFIFNSNLTYYINFERGNIWNIWFNLSIYRNTCMWLCDSCIFRTVGPQYGSFWKL